MASNSLMIPFEEARRIVMERVRPLGTERVSLAEASGRVLAEDISADRDVPPFNKSAMDGYACRREDLGGPLSVTETIPAGKSPTRAIGPGECAKIMTGAPVPEGADTVFMVEYSEHLGEEKVRFNGTSTHTNIIPQAEDFSAGDQLLTAGIVLRPDHIAVLATVGVATPLVTRRPRVGVIATGDELVEPAETPGPSQIRNSNSHQLVAQVNAAGAVPAYYGIAPDSREALGEVFGRAARENDVLLLSGGVSQGDFDFVPDIMRAHGAEILFDRVRIKPGKPSTFGVGQGFFCFGMPGNPVATYVIFEVLVRPFLQAMMGLPQEVKEWTARLDTPIFRKKDARDEWLPVKINGDGGVDPVPYHGSAHFLAMTRADGLTMVPKGTRQLAKGTEIRVRPLPA